MYDYIVVGAGSAGCVMAARLTEDPNIHVALIEAGAPDTADEIHIPAAFGSLFKSEWDWDLDTEPEPYWEREDATKESIRDGWLLSGDLAQQDEDGYYFIVDRKKDLIIRGGCNVYPRAIWIVDVLPKGPTGKILRREISAPEDEDW